MKRLPFWKRPYFAKRLLDIGAGHRPFHGATHLLERDLHEGRERGFRAIVVPKNVRLVVGDIAAIPFQAGRFDYVYASHVMEHVLSPQLACQEIMRVGTAGYIETPSPFLEQGLALGDAEFPEHWFHRWLVFSPRKNLLVFEPKNAEEVSRFCSCPDGQFLREFYASVDFCSAQHYFRRATKTTMLYWQSSFEFEVRDRTLDCRHDGRLCRFAGMRSMLIKNCNDCFRPARMIQLTKHFPACRAVFRKYGHSTLFVH